MTVMRNKTAFFVSNKADILTKKVNEFLDTLPEFAVFNIEHSISYTSDASRKIYMISCMVWYKVSEEVEMEDINEVDLSGSLDFGISSNPEHFG